MRYFNPIHREYVAPVDLNTLATTYGTLEQSHKQAVAQASDIKNKLAALDLNEAEDEWRNGKVNEVTSMLQANTNFGNSAAALDDLIVASSDILFGADTMGRLKAQQDYKKYLTELDNAKIPDEYKEMFRELNPYYYEDTRDKKGNIIGGTKWTPNVRPVDTVDLSNIVVKGIQIAAKESGQGSQTRWLDEYGKITTDPSKAFDGEVYSSITNSWERLGRDKILAGINAMIEETPGAKASLKQDYDYAEWKHKKNVATANGEIVIDDFTDANGRTLSEDEYLVKRIMPAVKAAEYYNSKSSTSYGNGLKSYKAAQAALAQQSAQDNNARQSQYQISGNNSIIEFKNTITAVDVNADVSNAKIGLQNYYKAITGNDLFVDDKQEKITLESLITKNNIPEDKAIQLRSYVSQYNDALAAKIAYKNTLSKEDQANFDYLTRLNTGTGFVASQNGGSSWDDKTINKINAFWAKGGTKAVIKLDPTVRANLEKIINSDGNNLLAMGITIDNNNNITITKNNDRILPFIANAIHQAEANSNLGVGGTLLDWIGFGNNFDITIYDKNGNTINTYNNQNRASGSKRGMSSNGVNVNNFNALAELYSDATKMQTKMNETAPKVDTFRLSNLNFEGENFTHTSLLNQYDRGFIDEKTFNLKSKFYNDAFQDAIIIGGNYAAASIYGLDESNDGVKRKINSKENLAIGEEIRAAFKDNRLKWSPTISSDEKNSMAPIYGYNITIMPKADKNGKIPENAIPKVYTIFNIGSETAANAMLQDPNVRNSHKAAVLASTKGSDNLSLSSTMPIIGTTTIKGVGDDALIVNFLGQDIPVNIINAGIIGENLEYIEAIKANGYDDNNKRHRKAVVKAAMDLSTATGIAPEIVLDYLVRDIAYGY